MKQSDLTIKDSRLEFLVRPKPFGLGSAAAFHWESQASWLARFFIANGRDTISHPGEAKYWRLGAMDSGPKQAAWQDQLAKLSGHEVSQFGFTGFGNKVQPHGADGVSWSYVGGLNMSALGSGHVVCAHCLADDEVPYWRKSWRMAFIVDCPFHRTPMLEACQGCGATFSLQRKLPPSLSHCPSCSRLIVAGSLSQPSVSTKSVWVDLFDVLPCHRSNLKRLSGRHELALEILSSWPDFIWLFNFLAGIACKADPKNDWFHSLVGMTSTGIRVERFCHCRIAERRQVLTFVEILLNEFGIKFAQMLRNKRPDVRLLEGFSYIAGRSLGSRGKRTETDASSPPERRLK
ncbi:TniQ family protein [Polaromonas sp. AER18D-145]|uniref:TniQ family protein n=1 Tax=Polaromonas sp. AER18D-145 TaxID=1977060 RepID=UPI001481D312|nr:TniQ family protein [Polaromonas sp. AER18D-145]